MMNRTNSERLEVIIQKLDKIIDLMQPKAVDFQVVTATDAPNGFSIDSDGSVEINDAKIDFSPALPIGKITLGQHSRKRLIKAAQDVHRILASNVYSSPDGTTFMYRTMKDGQRKRMCTADFIVSKEKRKVICLLKDMETNKVTSKGIAKCDPADVFNVDIGTAIALYRALGLNVPSDYLNVPNPTDYEAGQIVEWTQGIPFLIIGVDGTYGDFKRIRDGKIFSNFKINTETYVAKIIEDGVEL